jgi:hypothetical protein
MSKIDMTGWTPEQVKEYESAERELGEVAATLGTAEAAIKAMRAAPAHLIAAKRAEAAAKRAELERLARDARADEAYERACAEHGGPGRVAIVRTVEGAIVMRAMTSREIDEQAMRGADLSIRDRETIGREGIRDTVLFPEPKEFDAFLERHHGMWGTLAEVRDKLISGLREEQQKKG